MHLYAAGFNSEEVEYEQNLSILTDFVAQTEEDSLIVAPEVVVTNFDYDRFEMAAAFSKSITSALLKASSKRSIITTQIESRGDQIYNIAKVYHKGSLIYSQKKAKLFTFGGEHNYFSAGSTEQIELFEIDGIKVGILICFELRFIELWQRLRGADIIVVPAQWGRPRSEDFRVLGRALAMANQCFVIQSDTHNIDTTATSRVIAPSGEYALSYPFERSWIKKIRRYLNIGVVGG